MIGMPSNLLVLKYCDYFVWIHLLSLNKFTSDYFTCTKYCECKKKSKNFPKFLQPELHGTRGGISRGSVRVLVRIIPVA